MEDELATDSLSVDEQAYFDSRGESAPEGLEDNQAQAAVEGQHRPDPQVPLRAVTREREENRRLKGELDQLRTKQAVLEDRWNTMLAAQQPDEPEPPDPEHDIFAAFRYQNEQLRAMQEREEYRQQAEYQAAERQHAEAQIWNFWERSRAEFAQTTPDFGDAATFLAEARDRQLQALGAIDQRMASKQGRDAQMNAELQKIIVGAAQRGLSPAQAVYELARAWGYGGASARGGAAGQIADLARAVNGEVSLSSASGRAGGGHKTAEDIAAMTADEFEAWFAKAGDRGFKRVMQGA